MLVVKCGSPKRMWSAERECKFSCFIVYSNSSLTLCHCLFLSPLRFVPYIGVVTILMNLYPQLKFVLLAGLGVFVLVNRE